VATICINPSGRYHAPRHSPLDRIPVGARFSAPVHTGPWAHPASCTMGTGSFPGIKRGRGVTLTAHPLLVPWSWKSRATPLLPLRDVRPVQRLSACKRGRGVTLTAHPLLVPWSWKSRATPLLPLRDVRPVQRLSACTRVHFTLYQLCRSLTEMQTCVHIKYQLFLSCPNQNSSGSNFLLNYIYLSDSVSLYNSGRWPIWRTITSIICLFESSTCSEQLCAHPQVDSCINTTSGIITVC